MALLALKISEKPAYACGLFCMVFWRAIRYGDAARIVGGAYAPRGWKLRMILAGDWCWACRGRLPWVIAAMELWMHAACCGCLLRQLVRVNAACIAIEGYWRLLQASQVFVAGDCDVLCGCRLRVLVGDGRRGIRGGNCGYRPRR